MHPTIRFCSLSLIFSRTKNEVKFGVCGPFRGSSKHIIVKLMSRRQKFSAESYDWPISVSVSVLNTIQVNRFMWTNFYACCR
jgi:hypothetical protein